MTKIESVVREGKVQGQEVFLLTDNSMFELTYYRGYSMSRKFSAIILRLYQAIRDGDLILHAIHVAVTRMKAWGVDGLFRGFFGRHDGQTRPTLVHSFVRGSQ